MIVNCIQHQTDQRNKEWEMGGGEERWLWNKNLGIGTNIYSTTRQNYGMVKTVPGAGFYLWANEIFWHLIVDVCLCYGWLCTGKVYYYIVFLVKTKKKINDNCPIGKKRITTFVMYDDVWIFNIPLQW